MSPMKLMLYQMKLLLEQPLTASETLNEENEKEWFQFFFNNLITNYLILNNATYISVLIL